MGKIGRELVRRAVRSSIVGDNRDEPVTTEKQFRDWAKRGGWSQENTDAAADLARRYRKEREREERERK